MLGGFFIILLTLGDIFQAVIVPRAATTNVRISRYLVRSVWFLWPRIAARLFKTDEDAREDFFGTYAPFYLILLLVAWVVSLLIGWGLVFYGFRAGLRPAGLNYADTLYYAGASLLTIGYGDITPDSGWTRLFSIACGATGLAVVAVVISFLFAIFGAFQQREQFVVTLGARAGSPPTGVGLLEIHGLIGLRGDLAEIFREGQSWAAAVLETHLAYPVLMYFRSSHDFLSWVSTLGALLDASALVVTGVPHESLVNPATSGQARLMYEIGRHLCSDFAHYFAFMQNVDAEHPGIERYEFERALARLQSAGYQTRPVDEAWQAFSDLRKRYGPHLNALARWLEIPAVQWIGDRSLLPPRRTH